MSGGKRAEWPDQLTGITAETLARWVFEVDREVNPYLNSFEELSEYEREMYMKIGAERLNDILTKNFRAITMWPDAFKRRYHEELVEFKFGKKPAAPQSTDDVETLKKRIDSLTKENGRLTSAHERLRTRIIDFAEETTDHALSDVLFDLLSDEPKCSVPATEAHCDSKKPCKAHGCNDDVCMCRSKRFKVNP